jgi:2-polyprenyl-6-hydroxyphenyl methylase/3-demethylubiquinone-9 3-methyltransferase
MARLDRLAARYHTHNGKRQEFVFGGDERAGLIASLVGGPGLDVLDLGCRTGALTQHYATGNTVTGVDVDHGALEQAVERLGIGTVWADVEEGLPFDDGSFDVVVAGELLEHLGDPAGTVADVFRVLRPGGRFVGSVPNSFRLKSRICFAAGRHPEADPTHLQLFTPAALRALLSESGDVEIRFAVGRYVRWHPRLLAGVQVFRAQRPV